MKTFVDFVKKESLWLKSRIEGLRGKMSAQRIPILEIRPEVRAEIRTELREVGESLLLILISLLLYGSVVLAQFSFVPIVIITIKRGWKETLLYLTGALVLLLLVMAQNAAKLPVGSGLLLFSPTHYTFEFITSSLGLQGGRFLDYYVLFGILGIFLGSLVSRNYRFGYVVFFSLSVYVGIVILALSFAWFIGGYDRFITEYSLYVEKKISAYVHYYMNRMLGYKDLLLMRGIDYAIIEKKAAIAAEMYKRSIIFGIAPRGGYLIKELAVILIGLSLVKLYFKGKLTRAAFNFGLRSYTIGDDWVWGAVISWGLVYINLHLKNPLLGIVGWNSAVIVSLLFFLKGLALLKVSADRLRVPPFFQYLVFIFLFFYSFILFVMIVSGLGVADIWLKIREHVDTIKKREK
jgi:hypothetical protein